MSKYESDMYTRACVAGPETFEVWHWWQLEISYSYLAQAPILKDYYEGLIPTYEAAKRLTDPIDSEESLRKLWGAIVAFATDCLDTQEQAVDLLARISRQPTVVRKGATWLVQGKKVWKDMPLLKTVATKEGRGDFLQVRWTKESRRSRDVESTAGSTQGFHQKIPLTPEETPEFFTLAHQFMALCTATGIDALDFSAEGLAALHDALEQKIAPKSFVLDTQVQCAAMWIKHAGKALYRSEETFGEAVDKNSLWRGGSGFSKARWAFWKERFGWVQTRQLSEEGKEIAKAAVEEMERIEQSE
jgi:hypothetical protein